MYGTVTVLATHTSIYYCAANWHPGGAAGGYCGIQHNSEKERRTIFSIWDTSPKLHPKVTEADDYTLFGRFTNEGSGAHTHMDWDWKKGETFQFFLQKQRGQQRDTIDTRYYIFDRKQGKWLHSATITSPIGGHKEVASIGGGLNSFLENFGGKDADRPKLALYRLWLGRSVSTLRPLTRAGGDGTWGQLNDSYFLAEGSKEALRKMFLELEPEYGKPVFIPKGRQPRPLSNKRVPKDVLAALRKLPRAEKVQYVSDDPSDGGTYIIRSVVASKRLSVEHDSERKVSEIVQTNAKDSHVLWRLKKIDDNFFIIDASNNLVLDTEASGRGSRIKLEKRKQANNDGQQWTFVKRGDFYQIRNKQTDLVLNVEKESKEDGAAIIQWPAYEGPSPAINEIWMLTEANKEKRKSN